ncbi:hypothetical protein GGTG_07004 [Gaeumannomyces tritici R3-111a-1]|uniref:Uncharacterized protein n=1 Tax=Gaeumannomyces tritici (strain R3-111a-1) TaxID=644352 RepID=J3P0F8_GAET3|nr:hypothetical protein GGTG_07004 [Gaeumannomyces tritici R3-111a-1]EJT77091.1 hypothetical protein GGTG_07004 [Gaeumannomyces tritici R3-111a-1]
MAGQHYALLRGTAPGDDHNEKRGRIKNYARVGPEGQTRTVSATVCNAGLPFSGRAFVIARLSQQAAPERLRAEAKVGAGGGEKEQVAFVTTLQHHNKQPIFDAQIANQLLFNATT